MSEQMTREQAAELLYSADWNIEYDEPRIRADRDTTIGMARMLDMIVRQQRLLAHAFKRLQAMEAEIDALKAANARRNGDHR